MLNPPLSLLPDDLIAYIVEHVARLPPHYESLYNLSIADRAFTYFCQTHIFRTLWVDYSLQTKGEVSKRLRRIKKALNHNPSFPNRVRAVRLTIIHNSNTWLFNDPTLISIFRLLAESPMPPHEIYFGGFMFEPLIIEDPILLVGRLIQSFFSQTLTILHLARCVNMPLSILLICSALKEVTLDDVGVTEESYEAYPDNQCCGREAPVLGTFDYRASHGIVKQMVTPPSRFPSPVVLWSKLRVLTLSPHENEEMACLQPILNEAWESLEELYLTNIPVRKDESKQLPLAGLVNLNNLTCLRVFSLNAVIKCSQEGSGVLQDINTVLRTIPAVNQIANLTFHFTIFGREPFDGCLDQDWAGMCHEIIRISAGKPLELDLHTAVSRRFSEFQGQNELYASIIEKAKSISECPNICIHFWNPSYRDRGIGPVPRGQVRSRCRK